MALPLCIIWNRYHYSSVDRFKRFLVTAHGLFIDAHRIEIVLQIKFMNPTYCNIYGIYTEEKLNWKTFWKFCYYMLCWSAKEELCGNRNREHFFVLLLLNSCNLQILTSLLITFSRLTTKFHMPTMSEIYYSLHEKKYWMKTYASIHHHISCIAAFVICSEVCRAHVHNAELAQQYLKSFALRWCWA